MGRRQLGSRVRPTCWHAAGTYDKNAGDGGSDGSTMRFKPESDWGANAGLHLARAKLEVVKAKHPEISYADLWSFAGTVAIVEMGGPETLINLKTGLGGVPAASTRSTVDQHSQTADSLTAMAASILTSLPITFATSFTAWASTIRRSCA